MSPVRRQGVVQLKGERLITRLGRLAARVVTQQARHVVLGGAGNSHAIV